MTSEFREGTKMQKRARWTTKSYTFAYKMLVYRDGGDKCALCGREYGSDTTKVEKKHGLGSTVKLEIDEVDGNPGNHADWNLRLLCRTCNLAMGCGGCVDEAGGGIRNCCVDVCGKLCASMQRRQKTTRGARRADRAEENARARDRERTEGQVATRVVRQSIDFSRGSPEMAANATYENKFRQYVLTEIRAAGSISEEEAKFSGAEEAGCSPATGERYIGKLTHKRGPLQVIIDSAGQKQLAFKERLSTEERSIAI